MIKYYKNKNITAMELAKLFSASGIIRPVDDLKRIDKMIRKADFIISSYDNNNLVGIARCITDFSYCCYLSDLAVHKNYQRQGIGKALIDKVREEIGDEISLILLSSDMALNYYEKVGFTKANNAFLIKRKK